ncbi:MULTISPECIES: DUF3134 domain-containing protein [Cyanophyceae]|uniref:DUF3134 domain-containing protein n=1 Tax=Cyanophyceae TaxID=3028117 RepID=UPI0016877F1D|nr:MULTISPECIES: DUF3134 domain-containing protein [Cyanophyceae]MBD1919078.1 DUF3134 domain-containing protein [Phormidium sp. FACHB-77]MBD2033079.1 DUF3134 domain-containing protein [Phormidium sp. FACHB-322]MBD2054007.1 DUF3134 domain-containing protein [Leptolyngbya sp. FACHB-60]
MSNKYYNPSLRQVPRNAKAPILPSNGDSSILHWLESIGRLRTRDVVEAIPDEAENEEISDLMGNDDAFEDDDDTDLALDDDDD